MLVLMLVGLIVFIIVVCAWSAHAVESQRGAPPRGGPAADGGGGPLLWDPMTQGGADSAASLLGDGGCASGDGGDGGGSDSGGSCDSSDSSGSSGD